MKGVHKLYNYRAKIQYIVYFQCSAEKQKKNTTDVGPENMKRLCAFATAVEKHGVMVRVAWTMR